MEVSHNNKFLFVVLFLISLCSCAKNINYILSTKTNLEIDKTIAKIDSINNCNYKVYAISWEDKEGIYFSFEQRKNLHPAIKNLVTKTNRYLLTAKYKIPVIVTQDYFSQGFKSKPTYLNRNGFYLKTDFSGEFLKTGIFY